MASYLIGAVGVAGSAFALRSVLKSYAYASGRAGLFKSYIRGGFNDNITKSEAAQILGVREYASKDTIKKAHRRIMLLNHPDRGGSPYLATKINEAKKFLDKEKSSKMR